MRFDVLIFGEIEGGLDPFEHGELRVQFHRWQGMGELPLLEGALWAFIDWDLPQITGLEACRRLRCNPLSAQARITMVLPEDNAERQRQALRAGATECTVRPLKRTAILDRILSLHRTESVIRIERTLQLGELTVDPAAFQVRWRGKAVPLMPNEFRLLRYLVEHPGRVFTRSQLIAALGKHEQPIDERTVDVWIGRLRRALKAVGCKPLRTVRSLGYVLDPP